MLILLTAWVVHNWWKLLLGVVAIVAILEYHYYKKPAKEKTGREAEETEAEQKEDSHHENSDGK